MWYKFSSIKNNLEKYSLPDVNEGKWFEIVPQNIWLLPGTEFKVMKSIIIENNLPKSNFLLFKHDKKLDEFKDLEKAKKAAEKSHA